MSPEEMRQRNFAKRARERLQHMDQAAQDLQSALSLFPETKYEVIALLSPVEITDDMSLLNDVEPVRAEKQVPLPPAQTEMEEALFPSAQPGREEERRARPVREPESLQKLFARSRTTRKHVWLRSLAAILCVAFLVGTFALALQIIHQSASAPAGTPGLYVTTDNSVFRLASQDGQLSTLWRYTLSAPWTEQRVKAYDQQTHQPVTPWTRLIDSPVTVSGNVAYFGGNADDPHTHQLHHYLYALNATTGKLLWRYQIDGGKSGIPSPFSIQTDQVQMYNLEPGTVTGAPQVVQNTIYILVAVKPHMPQPHGPEYNQYYYIFALNSQTGVVRWSTRYFADSTQMSVASDGSIVYATDANAIMAFNGANGQKQWQKEIPRPNLYSGFSDLQFANGTLYATMRISYTTPSPSASSRIYAFDPANGSQLWVSRPVNGLVSPLVVAQNALYFGSGAGNVYALRLHDGSQLWDYRGYASDVFVSLFQSNGVVYARMTASLEAAEMDQTFGPYLTIVAIDARSGNLNWGSSIPPDKRENFGTGVGWDGGQLAVSGDIVYTSMQNGLVCSLKRSDGSFIACDTLAHTQMVPSLTLVGDASH
jgi:outer membrane protein assembly factor BamB